MIPDAAQPATTGMSTKSAQAENHTPTSKQRAPHSGSTLTSQHGAAIALAQASTGKALSSALGANFTRGLAADIQIGTLISADLQRLKAVAAGIDALQTMNPFLEAERERWKQLAEIANPCKGVLEGLQMQSIRFDSAAMIGTESLRRMAEDCAPRFSSLDIGLGSDAIGVLGSIGNLSAFGDLHAEMRIHAVPRLPSQRPARHEGFREAIPNRPPLSPVPEAPNQTTPTGWLEDTLDDEGGRRVLEQLSRFVRSEEIPSDAREGMDFLLALWKLKKTGLNKTEKHQLHLTVVDFLGRQLGVLPSADGLQQLASGLLVPHSHCKSPDPDLAPEIFTTQQLRRKLHSTTDTLKRHAKKACENGPLPQPMTAFPGWFVVSQSDPSGGQGRGWKFQQCRDPKEA